MELRSGSLVERAIVTPPTHEREGELSLQDDLIRFSSRSGFSWTVSLGDLAILGEYTNNDFPFVDDYFLVFVTGLETTYAASFYSAGSQMFLKKLGARLGTTLQCKLIASTDFASNVLWPLDIAGEPLFTFIEMPIKGIKKTLLSWFGFRELVASYSPKVLARLKQHP